MERELNDAAVAGDVTILRKLIQKDPLILVKTSLNSQEMNPLHIAAKLGHIDFVTEILQNNSSMCLAPDRLGRNPLHLAAIEGRLDVLKKLLDAQPQAAREKTAGGDTVLHLCVKYNQLEALKNLVETIEDRQLANTKNGDGMTVLSLAVCNKQKETIEYLLRDTKVDVNALNANGDTALDLFQGDTKSEIARSLKAAGAKRGKKIGPQVEWLIEKRDALMVAASLIATMTFQAGVTPPGGVWQDNTKKHKAGEAVMALNKNKDDLYKFFIQTNTVAFVSSLSAILLLLSGLPFQRSKFFTWFLTVVMWMTVTAAALTYVVSIHLVTPGNTELLGNVTGIAVTVWCGLMALLLLGNTIRVLNRWLKRKCHGIDLLEGIKHGNWTVQERINDNQENIQMSSV